ncbi:hypothetical protein [Piscinibacter sp.]|uniref:hypothetical protein n=1 Tax=Piscinibacter sp. TaxID=1903157 RepID=UPI002CC48C8F|nr:hypothetical protein [Albitalea sp.]HUG25662.1 hypothetical protein [Albitalea sp.]
MAVAYADQAVLFDNTQGGDTGNGLRVHAALHAARLKYTTDTPAQWVQKVTGLVNTRAAELQALARDPQSRGSPPQPARLHGGVSQGPIIAIGEQYVLQHDESSRLNVLHDKVLLGPQVEQLVPRKSQRLSYFEGVVTVEPPQPDKPR